MKINKYFVIDFDSTFTKVEAFDALVNGRPVEEPRSPAAKAVRALDDADAAGADGAGEA